MQRYRESKPEDAIKAAEVQVKLHYQQIYSEPIRTTEPHTGVLGLNALRTAIGSTRDMVRDAYKGGFQGVARLHTRNKNESLTKQEERLDRFHNHRHVKLIADFHARNLLGSPPERTGWYGERPMSKLEQVMAMVDMLRAGTDPKEIDLPPESEESETFQRYYELFAKRNRLDQLMSTAHIRRQTDGLIGIKVVPGRDRFYGGNASGIVMGVAKRIEDCIPIQAPDDPQTMVGVLEWVADPDNSTRGAWRMFISGGWFWVTDGLKKADSVPNFLKSAIPYQAVYPWPIKQIPFVFWGDWESELEDATQQQRAINSMYANRDAVIDAQGHAQLVIAGEVGDDETSTTEEGHKPIKFGENTYIPLQDKQTGEVYYVNPEAPLSEHQEAIERLTSQGQREHDVPADYSFSQHRSPERPLAKVLTQQPSLMRRKEYISEAVEVDSGIAYLVAEYVSVEKIAESIELPGGEKPKFGAFEEFQFESVYPETPLPTDQREQRTADSEMVTAEHMTLEEFMVKHHPQMTARQIALQVQRVEQAGARREEVPGLGEAFGVVKRGGAA